MEERTHRNPRPVFGVPIVELIFSQEDSLPVPWFLKQLCDFIFLYGLGHKNLFDSEVGVESPLWPEYNKVVKSMRNGVDLTLTPEQIPIAIMILKRIFQFLPDPLVPAEALVPLVQRASYVVQAPPVSQTPSARMANAQAQQPPESSRNPGHFFTWKNRFSKLPRDSSEFSSQSAPLGISGPVFRKSGSIKMKKETRNSLEISDAGGGHGDGGEGGEGGDAARSLGRASYAGGMRKKKKGRGIFGMFRKRYTEISETEMDDLERGVGGDSPDPIVDISHQSSFGMLGMVGATFGRSTTISPPALSPRKKGEMLRTYGYVSQDPPFVLTTKELVKSLPIANRNVLHLLSLLMHCVACNKHASNCTPEILAEIFVVLVCGEASVNQFPNFVAASNAVLLLVNSPEDFFPSTKQSLNSARLPSLGIHTKRGLSEGIRLWSATGSRLTCITATPNRKHIWVGTSTGFVLIFKAVTNSFDSQKRVSNTEGIEDLESDGCSIWVATHGAVHIFDPVHRRTLKKLNDEGGAIKLSLMNRSLMWGLRKDYKINAWDTRKQILLRSFEVQKGLESILPQLVFVPQNLEMWMAGHETNKNSDKIVIFSFPKLGVEHQLPLRVGEQVVAMSPVGNRIWVASSSQVVSIWDPLKYHLVDKFSISESLNRYLTNTSRTSYFGTNFTPGGMKCFGKEVWMWSESSPRILIFDAFTLQMLDVFSHHLQGPIAILPLFSDTNERWEARIPSNGGIIASYSVVSCSRLPHEDVGKTVEEQSVESTEVTQSLISPQKQAPVYRGKHKQEDVAVQVIPTNLFFSNDVTPLVDRTVKLLTSLNHPNVMQFYGIHAGQVKEGSSPSLWIMREAVAGNSLQDCLEKHIEIDSFYVLRQISETLHFLHSALQNFLHGCIKLTAFFIEDDTKEVKMGWSSAHLRYKEKAKIQAFMSPEILLYLNSLKRKMNAVETAVSANMTTRTGTLTRQGAGMLLNVVNEEEERKKRDGDRETPGQSVSNTLAGFGERADVFSFGLLMLRVLTGEVEIPMLGSHEQLLQLCADNSLVKELAEPLSTLPVPMKRLCLNCLSLNPKDRPTFDKISAQLEFAYVASELPTDEKASMFWAASFNTARKVLYSKFLSSFASSTGQDVSEFLDTETPNSKGKFLKLLACDESEDNTIHISKFYELLRFFGPFRPSFLQGISRILEQGWFFGKQNDHSSNSLLERHTDTFLVRYASEIGSFTFVSITQKGELIKIRISRNDKNMFVMGRLEFDDLVEAVHVIAKKYNLNLICPGSPYSVFKKSILEEESEEEDESVDEKLGETTSAPVGNRLGVPQTASGASVGWRKKMNPSRMMSGVVRRPSMIRQESNLSRKVPKKNTENLKPRNQRKSSNLNVTEVEDVSLGGSTDISTNFRAQNASQLGNEFLGTEDFEFDPHSDLQNLNNQKNNSFLELNFSASFSASDGSKGKGKEESERGSGGGGGLLFDDTDGSWGGGRDDGEFSPMPIRGSSGEEEDDGWGKGDVGEERRVGFLEVESEAGSDPNSLGFDGSFEENDNMMDFLGRRPSVSDEESDLF